MEIERIMVNLFANAAQYNRVMDATEARLVTMANNVMGLAQGITLPLIAVVGAITAIGIAASTAGMAGVKMASDYQKAAIAFEVMTGSAQVGKDLLDDITKMAVETPFHSAELLDAGKQLKAFGVETSQIIPTLQALGDVSSGTGTRLDRIVLAFGQVRVAGRLMGTELRQFTDAGVPIMENLAAVMHKPVEMIRSMIHDGKIGFPEVVMAFNRMTSAGGTFAGLMDRINRETVAGRWESFTENIQVSLRNMALAAFEAFDVIRLLSKAVDYTKRFQGDLSGLKDQFRDVRDWAANAWNLVEAIAEWVAQSTTLRAVWAGVVEGVQAGIMVILPFAGGLYAAFKVMRDFVGANEDAVKSVVKIVTMFIVLSAALRVTIAVISTLRIAMAALRAAMFVLTAAAAAAQAAYTTFFALDAIAFSILAMINPFTIAVAGLTLSFVALASVINDLGIFADFGKNFSEAFSKWSESMKEAYGVFVEAIKSGDLDMAMKVVFKSIEFSWKMMVAAMEAEWNRLYFNLTSNANAKAAIDTLITQSFYGFRITAANLSGDKQGAANLVKEAQGIINQIKQTREGELKNDPGRLAMEQTNQSIMDGIDRQKELFNRDMVRMSLDMKKLKFEGADYYRDAGRFAVESMTGHIPQIDGALAESIRKNFKVNEGVMSTGVKGMGGVTPEQGFDWFLRNHNVIEGMPSIKVVEEYYKQLEDREKGLAALMGQAGTTETERIRAERKAVVALLEAEKAAKAGLPFKELAKAAQDAAREADKFTKATEDATNAQREKMLAAPAVSAEARKSLEDVQKQMEKGFGAYDVFAHEVNLAKEAFLGPLFRMGALNGLPGLMGGGVAGGGISNPKELRFALYEAYTKLGKSIGPEKYPTAALQGSQQAQDIINQNQMQQISVEEEILANIIASKTIQEQQRIAFDRAANFLERMFGNADKVVPIGFGDK